MWTSRLRMGIFIAVAWAQFLARELPHALGAAKNKTRQKKKHAKKQDLYVVSLVKLLASVFPFNLF